MSEPVLQVDKLAVSFPLPEGDAPAVREVGLRLERGESLAVVGESGCGKSVTALAMLGLIPLPGRVVNGSIRVNGRDVAALTGKELRSLRGREAAMVFQEPMSSLNPVFRVGYQLREAISSHEKLPRAELDRRCAALLAEVGVPEPAHRLKAYPHQLSGGLRQRVMIAAAIANRPALLIADEPTTALDVTVEAQIMALLDRLRRVREMALLLITHDLGLVAQHADRVAVMYAGYVVEEASVTELFAAPLHPYTRGLMRSMPGRYANGEKRPLQPIEGNVPHPLKVLAGCPFRDRCPEVMDRCADGVPPLEEKAAGRRARCIRVERDV